MRVALNASILRAPRTGIGQYVSELGRALSKLDHLELLLFDGMHWSNDIPNAPLTGYSRIAGLAKQLLPNAYSLRRRLQQHRFRRGAKQLKPHIYHEPSLWPFKFDGPMLMTLHDLTHVHYPETQPADRLREIERRLPSALKRAQRIFFDSHFVATEAQRYYGIPTEKVVVTPLGAAEHFHPRSNQETAPLLKRFDLQPREYVLCIGTLEPRKNFPFALDCYLSLPEKIRNRYPLVVAGMAGWHSDRLIPHLHRANSSGQVRWIGYQDDPSLATLLAGARLLLFPSMYEGFGLPVVEAMASGTPVLVSQCASLPEVAGDAGGYFEPGNKSQCMLGLVNLIEDDPLWIARRDAGLQRAKSFTWDECARITAVTYSEVLDRPL